MRKIIKKCDNNFFEKILNGDKNFEARLEDDCKFEEGDILVLKEVDENHDFTGREIEKKITFILRTKDCDFWDKNKLDKFGLTILSLK